MSTRLPLYHKKKMSKCTKGHLKHCSINGKVGSALLLQAFSNSLRWPLRTAASTLQAQGGAAGFIPEHGAACSQRSHLAEFLAKQESVPFLLPFIETHEETEIGSQASR